MANHKLYIDEFDEVDYELIAIHTSLESYRLAYFLNQKLPILLSRDKDEIQIKLKEGEVHFTRYLYENKEENTNWNLIENKNEILIQKIDNDENLFANTSLTIATKVYLIPELKKVDYFLKIEEASLSTEQIVNAIHSIDRVEAVYSINTNQIKSKNNLIF